MKRESLYFLAALIAGLLATSCNSYSHVDRARPMSPQKENPKHYPVLSTDTVKNRHADPTIQPPGTNSGDNPTSFGAVFASGAVNYIVDDQAYIGEVRTEEDLTSLYFKLLDYAKLGHSICIAAPNRSCLDAKGESIKFSSTSEREVAEWATKMIKNGFSVTIDYNKSTHTYHCTAFKPK